MPRERPLAPDYVRHTPSQPGGGRNRAALVEKARLSIKQGSKSFSAASRLFDRTTRERVWLLYAWCRRCDDLADAQDHGGELGDQAGAIDRVEAIRVLTRRALEGQPTADIAFDAFGLVARECGITQAMADDVIAGFELDARDWRPRSEGDLLRYCYHVAGAVGVMMAMVMGVSPQDEDTLDRACDLGLAFQLANIARDIEQDDRAGRCYLPLDWLVEMDMPPGEELKPFVRPRLAVLARRLATMAARYEASARVGAARLPFRARWAVLAAANIYGAIAREAARRGNHAWDYRIVIGRWAKLGLAIKALGSAVRPS